MNEENYQEYQVALENVRYQGQLVWTIMGIFLIAQSVILQSILVNFSTQNSFRGSFIGILLSIMWIPIYYRNWSYFEFRMAQAKAKEPSKLNLLKGDGEKFSDGEPVSIKEKPYRMHLLGRIIRTKNFSGFIWLFLIVYLFIFLWGMVDMLKWWIC